LGMPICFSLADADFWKVVNKGKRLIGNVEDSAHWAPDTFAELKVLALGKQIYADMINTGFVLGDKNHWLVALNASHRQEHICAVDNPDEKLAGASLTSRLRKAGKLQNWQWNAGWPNIRNNDTGWVGASLRCCLPKLWEIRYL